MANLLPLLIVVGVLALVSWLYRRHDGAAHRIDATFSDAEVAELGIPADGVALLLFTAPGCPPCTVARDVLAAATRRHDVPLLTADVTEHHAIAARQHVYRAPTVFVVTARGHAVARISGVPRPDELDEVLRSLKNPRRLAA